jgi:hypothetical protein
MFNDYVNSSIVNLRFGAKIARNKSMTNKIATFQPSSEVIQFKRTLTKKIPSLSSSQRWQLTRMFRTMQVFPAVSEIKQLLTKKSPSLSHSQRWELAKLFRAVKQESQTSQEIARQEAKKTQPKKSLREHVFDLFQKGQENPENIADLEFIVKQGLDLHRYITGVSEPSRRLASTTEADYLDDYLSMYPPSKARYSLLTQTYVNKGRIPEQEVLLNRALLAIPIPSRASKKRLNRKPVVDQASLEASIRETVLEVIKLASPEALQPYAKGQLWQVHMQQDPINKFFPGIAAASQNNHPLVNEFQEAIDARCMPREKPEFRAKL